MHEHGMPDPDASCDFAKRVLAVDEERAMARALPPMSARAGHETESQRAVAVRARRRVSSTHAAFSEPAGTAITWLMGRQTRNAVPAPRSLRTSMRPPCRLTMP